jgi:hypothetical protein
MKTLQGNSVSCKHSPSEASPSHDAFHRRLCRFVFINDDEKGQLGAHRERYHSLVRTFSLRKHVNMNKYR